MEEEISGFNINPSDLKHTFLSDKPLEGLEGDELNRENFSKRLGEIILKYNSEEELILGICGDWGSGKTSIIKMALEYINKNNSSENDLYLLNFNPWLFSNQNQLITKFFEELGSKINDDAFITSLKSYVNKLVPPILGLATIVDPIHTNALLSSVNSIGNLQSEEKSLESLKNKLNQMILEKNCKIVVVIDDIDRLNKIEMLQIFKLVKLLADFPNTIYLLAFDKKVVQKSLEDLNEFKGLDYLKKVIPIMVDIPSISENDLRDLYFKYISNLIEDLPNKIDSDSLVKTYDEFLKYFIKNMRDLKRYINNLNFNLELVKKEIDLTDFLSITAIQVFRPDLYDEIWKNKVVFIYTSEISANFENEVIRQRENLFELIENEKELSKDRFIKILSIIFPKVRDLCEKRKYVGPLPKGYYVTKKIQFEEHFDTYFRFSVPKWELSNIEFESILESKDLEEFTNKFLKITDYKKIKFLESIKTHCEYIPNLEGNRIEIPEEKLEMLLEFNILTGNMLSKTVFNEIKEISVSHIKYYDEDFIKTKNLINAAENPYASCLIVDELIDILENESEIVDELLDELKKICIVKIEEYIQRNGLKNLNDPIYVSLCWSKWDNEKNVRNVIESLDDDNIRILVLFYLNKPIDAISDDLNKLALIHDLRLLQHKIIELLKKQEFNDENEMMIAKKFIKIIEIKY